MSDDAPSGVQGILAAEVLARMADSRIRQRDLAMIVGLSEKHLSQMLTGRAHGSLTMWDRLLDALPRMGEATKGDDA